MVAVMVRTRSQTSEKYWPSLQANQWETPLVEVRTGAYSIHEGQTENPEPRG